MYHFATVSKKPDAKRGVYGESGEPDASEFTSERGVCEEKGVNPMRAISYRQVRGSERGGYLFQEFTKKPDASDFVPSGTGERARRLGEWVRARFNMFRKRA